MEMRVSTPEETNPAKQIQLQDINIYYEHYPHGKADAPVLIMIHGFLGSCFSFRRIIPILKEHFHIYAIDLPGFGKSEKSRTFMYSLKNYGQLIADFIESLKIENVYVIGHSMGGQVAMHASKIAADKINKLILIGCSGYLKRPSRFIVQCSYLPFFVYVIRHWISKKGVHENLLTVVHNPSLIDDELINGYAQPFNDQKTFHALIRVLRHREGDMQPAELQEVSHPILLLWGKHDQVIPLPVGERMVNDLPNAKLKVFEKAGHLLPEEIPEEISEEICGFFDIVKLNQM
ncbi:alpha/beta fold hydrolase [Pseudalkalibacillus salsuginis]|uniref:alpha/beta fold hydrolase n=1 Tax=Pseudalkalibacillus salsuginis TaxID=2910972 RepID=UPI001F428D69|nr:alpha/beta hydrolase [Pseudalkalibacillus salsuginis]MCF6409033.1 alpha/beta hydrolase [Pseudalkalibacillus salsuginis]